MDPQKFNGSDEAWREEICHILFHEKFVFCLVCQRDIASDVKYHIMESDHQTSKKKLFSSCIQDPFCDSIDFRFSEVVSNSKSDILRLLMDRNRQSYVYQSGESLICLVCEEPISNTTSVVQMKRDLESHLGALNHSHVQNIIERFSWVYCLDKASGFILFQKLLVYCSVCDQILDYVDNLKLYAAVGHLETGRHKIKLEQMRSTEKNRDELEVQLPRNTDEDSLNPSVSFSDSDSGSSEYDSACEEISEFLEDNTLTCPECGDAIEMLNDNAELSLEFHLQKHKDLSVVNASLGYEYQEGADYVCPVCMEGIPIFNRDVQLSVKRHFEEKRHDTGTVRIDVNGSSTFLNNAFQNILKDLEVHRTYFTLNEGNMVCKLCSCIVQNVSGDLTKTCQTLRCHVSESFHGDQHKLATQQMAHAVLSYNNELAQQVPTHNDIFEKLASKNSIINKNRKFIKKLQIHYLCKICQKHICYSPKENNQVLNFISHFNSTTHQTNLKRIMESEKEVHPDNNDNGDTSVVRSKKKRKRIKSYDQVLKHISKSFPQIYQHTNYLEYDNFSTSNVYCNLCQEYFKLSKKGINIKTHCQSESHVANVERYSI